MVAKEAALALASVQPMHVLRRKRMPYVRVSLGRMNLIGLLAITDQRLSVGTTFPLAFVREMGIVDLITNSSQF